MSDSPLLSSRGSQPGAPRRTSSWCTKNSTELTRSSTPGSAITDSAGGPDLMIRTRSGNGVRFLIRCCTRAVYPASGPPATPAAASGRRSRSTRCAARSPVVQPSHSVGASGPVLSSSAHNARRSSRE